MGRKSKTGSTSMAQPTDQRLVTSWRSYSQSGDGSGDFGDGAALDSVDELEKRLVADLSEILA